MSMTSFHLRWCGGASTRRDPSNMPAGYVSHTGYQYDSISRVAGQRLLAPPSNFSKEGGLRNSVFKGVVIASILAFRAAQSRLKLGGIVQGAGYPRHLSQAAHFQALHAASERLSLPLQYPETVVTERTPGFAYRMPVFTGDTHEL